MELMTDLQEEAPRTGLGAADGHFVDHVAGVAERYGRNLFHCFDDDRIPPTSNGIEGFFGATKAQIRHALGTSSTTNGVAQNLGAEYLLAFAHSRATRREELLARVAHLEPAEYDSARSAIHTVEEPARLRRSRKRFPERHLDELLARWRSEP